MRRIDRRSRAGILRLPVIGHALGKRPVCKHTEIGSHTALYREKHAFVIGGTRIIEHRHVREVLSFNRVLQIQHTALIGVAQRGARTVDSGIELASAPEMLCVIAEVAGRDEPLLHLALHPNIPLVQSRRMDMQRIGRPTGESVERRSIR